MCCHFGTYLCSYLQLSRNENAKILLILEEEDQPHFSKLLETILKNFFIDKGERNTIMTHEFPIVICTAYYTIFPKLYAYLFPFF